MDWVQPSSLSLVIATLKGSYNIPEVLTLRLNHKALLRGAGPQNYGGIPTKSTFPTERERDVGARLSEKQSLHSRNNTQAQGSTSAHNPYSNLHFH